MRPLSTIAFLSILSTVASGGCGSSGPVPWKREMRRWFNNASVQPPEPARRDWTRQEEDRLLRRMGLADLAAIGTIDVVVIASRFDEPQQLRLLFQPRDVLYGEPDSIADDDGLIPLAVREGEVDFYLSIKTARRHLAGSTFLLFAKKLPGRRGRRQRAGWERSLWPELPGASREFRWALYRDDPRLLREVRALYRWHHEHKDD